MNSAISQIKISSAVRNGDRVNGHAIEVDTKIAVKFAATDDFDRFVPDAILVVSGLFRLASQPATVGLLVRNIVAEVFIPTSYNEMDEEPDFDESEEQIDLSDAPAPAPVRKKRAAKSVKSTPKKPSRRKESASVSIVA